MHAQSEINKMVLPNAQETQLEDSINLFREFPNANQISDRMDLI